MQLLIMICGSRILLWN